MLLWNRQLTISPDSLNAGMAGMVDAVTHVNSVSDYEFALWAPVLGTFGRWVFRPAAKTSARSPMRWRSVAFRTKPSGQRSMP